MVRDQSWHVGVSINGGTARTPKWMVYLIPSINGWFRNSRFEDIYIYIYICIYNLYMHILMYICIYVNICKYVNQWWLIIPINLRKPTCLLIWKTLPFQWEISLGGQSLRCWPGIILTCSGGLEDKAARVWI